MMKLQAALAKELCNGLRRCKVQLHGLRHMRTGEGLNPASEKSRGAGCVQGIIVERTR